MEIFHSIYEIRKYVSLSKNKGATIGFVPTMGALHKGHITLVERAKKENNLCVCSIFVNPIQFNNKEDLFKYPRSIETDIEILKQFNCDILFAPSEKEIYPEPDNTIYDLGGLDKLMEGAFRSGHFNGVAVVVKRLFDIVESHRVYFGEKDFQQLAIIKYLIKKNNIPVEVVSCPTIREPDGLAMSSRNAFLTTEERKVAPLIYQTLKKAREIYKSCSIEKLKTYVVSEIESCPQLKIEYFEVVHSETLESADNFNEPAKCIACIAVYLGKVRLIDNIFFL
jgi:pantoate--beta-alanine ligase